MDMYQQATTVIGAGGKITRKIQIKAGVKQGCPLSPFLFNIVMDELIEQVEQKKIGVKIGDNLINIMAFADDLVLITEEPGDMKVLLQICEIFFNKKGLSVNSTKCASLKVLPVKGKKSMKVITEIHRYWKGEPIPSITFKELGKYLGLHVNHAGKVELPRRLWEVYLERIKKSCLTVFQKIRVIKEVICSKILFQLRLSDHGLEEARKLDRVIRVKVKEILHLPTWTSTDCMQSKEGLGLMELQCNTMIAWKKASEKMLLSHDKVAQTVASEVDPINGKRLEGLQLHTIQVSKRKTTWINRRLQNISNINNGKAIRTMMSTKHPRGWLWSDIVLRVGNKV